MQNHIHAPGRVQALLFDLGGVLIDIDFDRVLRHWAPMSALPFESLKATFGFDEAYERHERGEIGTSEYFDSLRVRLRLDGSDEDIARGWNSVFTGEIPGSLDAVRRARERLPCYAFTNTNPVHYRAWTGAFPGVTDAFDRVFVSCQLGLRKPERAAFDAVTTAIGVPAEAILFFDDTLENVLGAQRAGLQAVHVRRPADLQDALGALR